jgi:hypothetical protein
VCLINHPLSCVPNKLLTRAMFSSLTFLDLEDNLLGPEELKGVARGLAGNMTLTHLNLRNNSICKEGVDTSGLEVTFNAVYSAKVYVMTTGVRQCTCTPSNTHCSRPVEQLCWVWCSLYLGMPPHYKHPRVSFATRHEAREQRSIDNVLSSHLQCFAGDAKAI